MSEDRFAKARGELMWQQARVGTGASVPDDAGTPCSRREHGDEAKTPSVDGSVRGAAGSAHGGRDSNNPESSHAATTARLLEKAAQYARRTELASSKAQAALANLPGSTTQFMEVAEQQAALAEQQAELGRRMKELLEELRGATQNAGGEEGRGEKGGGCDTSGAEQE